AGGGRRHAVRTYTSSRKRKGPRYPEGDIVRDASPLRYPGGKWRLARFFERLIELNGLTGRRYIEPYAGGGSLALSLLIRTLVSEIHLHDLDPAIHAFWS